MIFGKDLTHDLPSLPGFALQRKDSFLDRHLELIEPLVPMPLIAHGPGAAMPLEHAAPEKRLVVIEVEPLGDVGRDELTPADHRPQTSPKRVHGHESKKPFIAFCTDLFARPNTSTAVSGVAPLANLWRVLTSRKLHSLPVLSNPVAKEGWPRRCAAVGFPIP